MDAEFSKSPAPSSPSPSSSASRTDSGLFTRHNDSVLCCSIDNRNRLAVSGGIDDTAFVWDLNTRHVIFECLEHKESVVAAAFSSNSTYVATGDLNGYIQVRNTTTGIKVFDYEIDEINWILWHSSSEFVLLAGTTKGDFWMWNVNDPAAVKTFSSYGSSCTAAKLLPDGMKIVVAYQDGSVRMFDLKTRQAVAKLQEPNSAEAISLDINLTKSILAVGCIDSSVRLTTLSSLRQIGQLVCKTPGKLAQPKTSPGGEGNVEPMDDDQTDDKCSTSTDKDESTNEVNTEDVEVIDEYSQPVGETDGSGSNDNQSESEEDDSDFSDGDYEQNDVDSVESVLFSPCGNFLAASNNSGTITIWDTSTQAMRCERHTGAGITRCAWTSGGQYITGSLDGTIRFYDINLNELKTIEAHNDQILDLAYRDNVIVTASEDKTCRVTRL